LPVARPEPELSHRWRYGLPDKLGTPASVSVAPLIDQQSDNGIGGDLSGGHICPGNCDRIAAGSGANIA